jgi:hypothetical protein
VIADGHNRLLYELHVTNFSPKSIELTGLDVLGGDGGAPLARYRGETLEKLLFAVGPKDSAGKLRGVGGGSWRSSLPCGRSPKNGSKTR